MPSDSIVHSYCQVTTKSTDFLTCPSMRVLFENTEQRHAEFTEFYISVLMCIFTVVNINNLQVLMQNVCRRFFGNSSVRVQVNTFVRLDHS